MKKKKISIITGVFNEETTAELVYTEIKKVFKNLKKYNYEHIFLDNHSTDNSLSILRNIAKIDKNVKVISYSKNFGPINSGFVGLTYSSGDGIIFYECNLKDPPALIPEFIKYWEQEYKLVYGLRKKTSDNIFMSFARRTFYVGLSFLSSGDLPPYFGGFALIDKAIVNEIKKIDDYKPYLRGLIATAGFKHKSIEYKRLARKSGKSKSNLPYLIDFTINAIISYSIIPIRFCTFLGLGIASISILTAIIYMTLNIFIFKDGISALSIIVFLILIFSGIQLFFLGIIGEYIGAIHSQVRRKPFVIIEEKINI